MLGFVQINIALNPMGQSENQSGFMHEEDPADAIAEGLEEIDEREYGDSVWLDRAEKEVEEKLARNNERNGKIRFGCW